MWSSIFDQNIVWNDSLILSNFHLFISKTWISSEESRQRRRQRLKQGTNDWWISKDRKKKQEFVSVLDIFTFTSRQKPLLNS